MITLFNDTVSDRGTHNTLQNLMSALFML